MNAGSFISFWGHEITRQADLAVCLTEKVTGVTADYIGP